jgi:Ca2+-binding RTX toxin-like protein
VGGGGGDDQIVGGRAADYLNGETGDDKLTGGKGSDYFVVDDDDGVGHEVITDLHTKGAAKDDFYTDLDIVTTKSVHRHEDTLLIASNGSTILLENVTKQEWLDFITL